MTLANRIKAARVAAGIKEPADLARRVGKKPSAAYQWEDGSIKSLKGETLLDLADVLGVNPRWLLTGKGEMKSQTLRVTPETIIATREILALYLRFANQPASMGTDPKMLASTLTLVLAHGPEITERDKAELAIKLADRERAEEAKYGHRGDAG